jgi:hypothetical protein
MKRKDHVNNAKHCARCDQWQNLTAYHSNRRNWDGLHAYCRVCMAASASVRYARERPRLLEQARVWRADNPEKRKDIALRSKFGITLMRFREMEAAQDGKCAICRHVAILAVDHCHATGKVRGLLCMPCNTAIGQLGDDPARIRFAADYVETGR